MAGVDCIMEVTPTNDTHSKFFVYWCWNAMILAIATSPDARDGTRKSPCTKSNGQEVLIRGGWVTLHFASWEADIGIYSFSMRGGGELVATCQRVCLLGILTKTPRHSRAAGKNLIITKKLFSYLHLCFICMVSRDIGSTKCFNRCPLSIGSRPKHIRRL